MVSRSEEGITSSQGGGKLSAKDGYALLAEEKNVVFRADTEDTGYKRKESREIGVGGEFVKMARCGIYVSKYLNRLIK